MNSDAGKWFWRGLLLLLLGVGSLTGTAVAQVVPVQPVLLKVARPPTHTVKEGAIFAGQTVAPQQLALRPSVSGQIARVLVEPGAQVTAGQLLFELDSRRAKALADQAWADVQLAAAKAKFAMEQHKRLSKLALLDGVSAETLLQADAARLESLAVEAQARAALRLRELDVDATRVVAPFAGRVGTELVAAGNFVTPASTLGMLVDTDKIELVFSLDQGAAAKFIRRYQRSSGQLDLLVGGLNFGLSDEADYPHPARYVGMEAKPHPETGHVQVRAEPTKDNRPLLPGLTVFVSLQLEESYQVKLVPPTAVQQAEGGHFIYIIGPTAQLEKLTVTLGPRVGELQALKSNLARAVHVVLDPPAGLQTDTKFDLQITELKAPR